MDLIIVAFYTLWGDLLIQGTHHDHPKAKMSTAEMTQDIRESRLVGTCGTYVAMYNSTMLRLGGLPNYATNQ